jgi:hypothetical protein
MQCNVIELIDRQKAALTPVKRKILLCDAGGRYLAIEIVR